MGARVAEHAVARHRSDVVHAARWLDSPRGFVLACGGRFVAENSVERWHDSEPDVARRAITCRSCLSALATGRCRWLVSRALAPQARAFVDGVAHDVETSVEPLVQQRRDAAAARAGARAAQQRDRIYATGRREHEACECSTPGCSIDHALDAGPCETW
jgi:hypothetical protein